MTIKKLAKLISKHEGKKVQVNIAQINEILGVLSDLIYKECTSDEYTYSVICYQLYNNGLKRANKNKKSKKT